MASGRTDFVLDFPEDALGIDGHGSIFQA